MTVPAVHKKIVIAMVWSLMAVSSIAAAQEVRLENIIITNTRDDLLLFFNVEGAFTEEIRDAVLLGVPTTFSYFITLHRVRNLWFDHAIADLKLTHTVKYDKLKNEFTVTRSWKVGPRVVKTLREAEKLMTDIDNLTVVPLSELKKGEKYQIRAKAELSRYTLPLYLHYVLFFMSLWDFETDWYAIDFVF